MNDEEIRTACAELMGWTNLYVVPGKSGRHPDGHVAALPAFDSDANAALELVSKLRDDGWFVLINNRRNHSGWQVRAYRLDDDSKTHDAKAETLPMVIAEIFLKVHGRFQE